MENGFFCFGNLHNQNVGNKNRLLFINMNVACLILPLIHMLLCCCFAKTLMKDAASFHNPTFCTVFYKFFPLILRSFEGNHQRND